MERGRIQSVELIVAAGFTANKIKFPDQPTLRSDEEKDALIFSMNVYTSDSVPFAPSGANNPVATFAQLQNLFLTLQITGNEQIRDISLIRLLDTRGNANGYLYASKRQVTRPLRIEWTESYIEFANPGTVDTPQYSVLFEFEYEWMPVGSYGKYLQALNNKWGAGIIGA
jgi:hypothetical protein